jgi:electron transport complex protein RnfG
MSVVKQMFAVLVAVGVLSSLVLAASYNLTEPRKQQNRVRELQEAIFVVLPEAEECQRTAEGACQNIGTEELRVYKGLDAGNQTAGYAFVAEGPGFQGPISMIVGIEPDLDTLLGMKVLEQVETPGLGAKISQDTPKPDFYEQFTALPIADVAPDFLLCLKRDDPKLQNDVEAITGATISSKAVVDIINLSLAKLQQLVPEQK